MTKSKASWTVSWRFLKLSMPIRRISPSRILKRQLKNKLHCVFMWVSTIYCVCPLSSFVSLLGDPPAFGRPLCRSTKLDRGQPFYILWIPTDRFDGQKIKGRLYIRLVSLTNFPIHNLPFLSISSDLMQMLLKPIHSALSLPFFAKKSPFCVAM
jgi:hypothetical protein